MRTYTLAEFQKNLTRALDQAENEIVLIERNGQEYEIRMRDSVRRSGLEVSGIDTGQPVTLDSILEDIQAGRERAENASERNARPG
jgi:hypothetical protein